MRRSRQRVARADYRWYYTVTVLQMERRPLEENGMRPAFEVWSHFHRTEIQYRIARARDSFLIRIACEATSVDSQ